jgi:hypothetical protein
MATPAAPAAPAAAAPPPAPAPAPADGAGANGAADGTATTEAHGETPAANPTRAHLEQLMNMVPPEAQETMANLMTQMREHYTGQLKDREAKLAEAQAAVEDAERRATEARVSQTLTPRNRNLIMEALTKGAQFAPKQAEQYVAEAPTWPTGARAVVNALLMGGPAYAAAGGAPNGPTPLELAARAFDFGAPPGDAAPPPAKRSRKNPPPAPTTARERLELMRQQNVLTTRDA